MTDQASPNRPVFAHHQLNRVRGKSGPQTLRNQVRPNCPSLGRRLHNDTASGRHSRPEGQRRNCVRKVPRRCDDDRPGWRCGQSILFESGQCRQANRRCVPNGVDGFGNFRVALSDGFRCTVRHQRECLAAFSFHQLCESEQRSLSLCRVCPTGCAFRSAHRRCRPRHDHVDGLFRKGHLETQLNNVFEVSLNPVTVLR